MILLYKNLPEERLARVMQWRFWLDALASLMFLLTGQWGSFLAVWKGRRAFRKMRADFRADREKNLQAAVVPASEILFPKSILWQYYIKGKKTYTLFI